MNVTTRRHGDTVTVAIAGELDAHTCGQVADALGEALASDASITVDLTDLEFIDSSGLRVLVQTRLDSSHPVSIRGANDNFLRLVEITGLEDHFVFETR